MPSPTPAELDGIDTGFVDVDGVAVHVGEVGTGTRGVLLLHHFYGNVATWRRVLWGLADAGVHAVALDRPGFGWSERPDPASGRTNPYTRGFAVRAAREVARAVGLDELVVVGSSMGGTLALELALDDPAGLAHLVLLSPAITGDVGLPAPLRPVLNHRWIRRAARPVVERLSRDITLERVSGGWADASTANNGDVAAYLAPTREPGWADGIWEVMTTEQPPKLSQRLDAVTVPATVVAGRHDGTIRPEWNIRTARALGADLVTLDSGHTPQEEAPAAVVDLVLDRLGRSVAGGPTASAGRAAGPGAAPEDPERGPADATTDGARS